MGRKSYRVEKVFSTNIRMFEYPQLTGEVKELVDYTVMNNLKQNSVLRLRKEVRPAFNSLWDLPWTNIIELRQALGDNNLEQAICLVYKINKYQYLRLGIFNAYAAYLWLAHQFKEMMEIEISQLEFEYDEEEKAAGIEELQNFDGYVVALDGLTGGDLLKYDEYLKLPYAIIFRKLCLDKTRYEINKNMQQNASRKLTNNS